MLPISIVNVSNFCNLSHTAKLQEALVDNCNLYEMFNLLHESCMANSKKNYYLDLGDKSVKSVKL